MSDSKEFKWNDELAGEFAYWYKNLTPPVFDPIKEFKKSKQVAVPDYEIVSFRGTGKQYSNEDFWDLSDGKYKIRERANSFWDLNSMLKGQNSVEDGQLEIYSVKRVSDSEVFSLGDKVKLIINKDSISKTIIKIAFEKLGKCPEQLFIYTDGEQSTINNYEKAKPKQVLFTTEDGKEIFNDDIYYYVDEKWNTHVFTPKEGIKFYAVESRTFWDKEKLNEWVLENKPIQIALCNILDIVGEVSDNAKGYDNKSYLRDSFREIFKQKIKP